MLLAQRIWNWCRRFRYRCGYGVHSPSDFFLITSVVYEDLPYYAYERLKMSSSSKSLPHYREKVNKLLFRLVNYFRPMSLIEVGEGNGDAFRYISNARTSMVYCDSPNNFEMLAATPPTPRNKSGFFP